ncbi:hypothetical protein OIU78_003747 [Salix suchowensis]|nr:hypothetical protein OIU78_003747 [Salix suchowensis]
MKTLSDGGVPHQQEKKQGGEEGITTVSFFDRIVTVDQHMIHGSVVTSPLWSSKGMVESVNQVCKDAAWGERREIGRIGLALQDYIFRDLIEEIVKDMGFDCIYQLGRLPFESLSWEMLLDWLDLGLVLGLGLGFSAFPAGFFDSSEICCLLSISADFSTARLFSVQLCVWLGYCWGRFLSARFTWVLAAQFPAFDHSSGELQ